MDGDVTEFELKAGKELPQQGEELADPVLSALVAGQGVVAWKVKDGVLGEAIDDSIYVVSVEILVRPMHEPGCHSPVHHLERGAYKPIARDAPLSVTDDRGSNSAPIGPRARSVISVMRRSSPVSRVAASTRAAVFTGSPMTVKSRRPPPPMVPTSTRPEFTPTPTRRSPTDPLADKLGDLTSGRHGASGMVGITFGDTKYRHQAIADELGHVSTVAIDHRHDHAVELVQA